jgi:hypothetical protein
VPTRMREGVLPAAADRPSAAAEPGRRSHFRAARELPWPGAGGGSRRGAGRPGTPAWQAFSGRGADAPVWEVGRVAAHSGGSCRRTAETDTVPRTVGAGDLAGAEPRRAAGANVRAETSPAADPEEEPRS